MATNKELFNGKENSPENEKLSFEEMSHKVSELLDALVQQASQDSAASTDLKVVSGNGSVHPISLHTDRYIQDYIALRLRGWEQLIPKDIAYDCEEIVTIPGNDTVFVRHGETLHGTTHWNRLSPVEAEQDMHKIFEFVSKLTLYDPIEGTESRSSAA